MRSNAAVATPNAWAEGQGKVPGYLRSVFIIVQLEALKMVKDPVELASRGFQPVLWLLLFGQALARAKVIDTGGLSYEAFLAPGILAQSITFVSIFSGLSIIWEKDMGLMQKVLSAPISRSALVLAKMLAAGVRSLVQLLVILILALALGIPLIITPASVAGVLGYLLLGSALFSALSMVIASLVRTRERMMGIGQLVTMPLFFASSALYPVSVMPDWLRVLAQVNPMSYLVDGLRGMLLALPTATPWADAGVLFMGALVLWGLGTRLYPKLLL
jgi:ABC-2 type transport system permease protein